MASPAAEPLESRHRVKIRILVGLADELRAKKVLTEAEFRSEKKRLLAGAASGEG